MIRPDETAYWDEILFFLFIFIICFVVIRPDETAYWDDHGLPELRARMPQVAMLMKTQVFFFIARHYALSVAMLLKTQVV